MELNVQSLGFSVGGSKIIDNISLQVHTDEFVGLVGPNGSGKSTLLKNIYRVYKPNEGRILINGTDIKNIKDREFAKDVSVMAQENDIEFDLTVLDMVMLGRYAHKKLLQNSALKDRQIAEKSLQEVGMKGYENRSFLSLSGGEKQRVLLARGLAQDASLMILDEPTNHLDIRFQYQIMNILKRQDLTVFVALHDLNIAALYCDKIIVLKDGKLIKIGTPKEIIQHDMIEYLYGIDSKIYFNAETGRPQVQFLPNFNA